MFSVNESREKVITLGWKIHLNAKFPFIFWNKIEIILDIKCCFECMLKKKLNLPLQMSKRTCIFRLVYLAFFYFLFFLLWPFFQSKAKIHWKFQGIWGSTCRQHPPPQLLVVSVSKPCPVHYLPMAELSPIPMGCGSPPAEDSPTQTLPPCPGKTQAAATLLLTGASISCDKSPTDSSSQRYGETK